MQRVWKSISVVISRNPANIAARLASGRSSVFSCKVGDPLSSGLDIACCARHGNHDPLLHPEPVRVRRKVLCTWPCILLESV